jgi:hypothetical protein
MSSLSGDGLLYYVADQLCHFAIEARDKFGLLVGRGGDSFSVAVRDKSGRALPTQLSDKQNGVYAVAYTAGADSGELQITAFHNGVQFGRAYRVCQKQTRVGPPAFPTASPSPALAPSEPLGVPRRSSQRPSIPSAVADEPRSSFGPSKAAGIPHAEVQGSRHSSATSRKSFDSAAAGPAKLTSEDAHAGTAEARENSGVGSARVGCLFESQSPGENSPSATSVAPLPYQTAEAVGNGLHGHLFNEEAS